MSLLELLARIFAEMKPLLPGVIVALAATALMTLFLGLRGRRLWLRHKKFPLPSLFFGLSGRGVLAVSCAWIKVLFVTVYVVSFQKLVLIQYLVVLVPGLILVFCAASFSKAMGAVLNLVLEMGGLLCAALICGYIRDTGAGTGFLLIYVTIAVFMVLFGLYLFLLELERISAARKIDPNEIWRIAENE